MIDKSGIPDTEPSRDRKNIERLSLGCSNTAHREPSLYRALRHQKECAEDICKELVGVEEIPYLPSRFRNESASYGAYPLNIFVDPGPVIENMMAELMRGSHCLPTRRTLRANENVRADAFESVPDVHPLHTRNGVEADFHS